MMMKRKMTMMLLTLCVSIGFVLAGAMSVAAAGEIAFTSDRDGNQEIYTMNADGTNQTNLTNSAGDDLQPSFSPNVNKIAFVSARDGNGEIYTMNADGSNPVRLTNTTTASTDLAPSWGGQLDTDDDGVPDFRDNCPTTPNPERVAFSSLRDGNAEIYVMNADGSNQVRLTDNTSFDQEPSFGRQADADGDGIGDACENTAPTITAAADLSRQQDSSANAHVATVVDAEQAPETLSVTATPLGGSGVTLTNLSVSPAGAVTADVAGSCAATDSTFTLRVTDDGSLFAEATLAVTVTPETTPPVITLNGASTLTVECHTAFADPGATATDNCAGSFAAIPSGDVDVNVPGTYVITYTATLVSGDEALPVTRTVNVVDTTAPALTLNGASTMTVECSTGFTDPGATATDGCAGGVPVTASGSVNTSVPGTYTVTYTASDNQGNTATATRTVNVVDTTAPTLTLRPSISLWPPNHMYRTVTMNEMVLSVADGCNTSLGVGSVVIEKVTSDEPDDVAGDADGITTGDIVIAADCQSVQLRAERNKRRNGRVYVITLRVRDATGNTTRREFRVSVPIEQGGTPAVQDAVALTRTSSCP